MLGFCRPVILDYQNNSVLGTPSHEAEPHEFAPFLLVDFLFQGFHVSLQGCFFKAAGELFKRNSKRRKHHKMRGSSAKKVEITHTCLNGTEPSKRISKMGHCSFFLSFLNSQLEITNPFMKLPGRMIQSKSPLFPGQNKEIEFMKHCKHFIMASQHNYPPPNEPPSQKYTPEN